MPKFKNREEYEQWKAESMRDLGAERKTPEDQDGQMIALDKCPDVVAEDSPPPLNITASNTQQGHTMQQTASPPRDGLICVNCGQLGRVKSYTRGSLGVELLLWIFFLVPGLIYSVWRQSTQAKVCRACGSPNVIPTSTPRGEQLWQELHSYRENWLRGEEKVSDTNGIKLRDNPLYFNILHFTPWRFPSITVVSPHVAMRRSHIHDAITVQTLFLLNPSTALLIYRLRLNLMAFVSDTFSSLIRKSNGGGMEKKYKIVGWVFGVLFALPVLPMVTKSIVAGLLVSGAAAFLLPPVRERVFAKTKITIPAVARVIAVFVLIAIAGHLVEKSDKAALVKQAQEKAVEESRISAELLEKKIAVFNVDPDFSTGHFFNSF